jgi:tyrosyl-DNA phosphodiesterase-1
MIRGDWTNMTQAVWRSPLLPLHSPGSPASSQAQSTIGSGARFKRDLLAYLKAYGPKKTGSLVQQLDRFDFGAIRAALIASVPSKQEFSTLDSGKATLWGWPALRDLMGCIPIQKQPKEGKSRQERRPHIVAQISSVASLGQTDKWLKDVFFKSLAPSPTNLKPKYSIIFPTADEIRRSLDGYASGGSIHMKIQSAPQQKQLQYMRPYLCHWAGDSPSNTNFIDLSEAKPSKREAGRGRAAPHIKTYIRYSDADTMETIDWAMVTSANLSTQAWGAGTNAKGEVRISSWEIGVVVWPELFVDGSVSQNTSPKSSSVSMVPCFKRDQPSSLSDTAKASTVVGFRVPYDLPLTPYSATDEPWCATASHDIPDWQGLSWSV